MALPPLPEREILGAFFLLEQETFYYNEIEYLLIKKLKVYYKKTWIIGRKGLSVFSTENATNNGAEAFHETLKSVITVHHPNIWKFLSDLNKVILDFELEYQRLEKGLAITRKPKRQTLENAARRNTCKEKLQEGKYSITQYLAAVSATIGAHGKHTLEQFEDVNTEILDESNCDDGDDNFHNTCIICCQPRQGTYALIFVVTQIYVGIVPGILLRRTRCPICRTEIHDLMQIFQ